MSTQQCVRQKCQTWYDLISHFVSLFSNILSPQMTKIMLFFVTPMYILCVIINGIAYPIIFSPAGVDKIITNLTQREQATLAIDILGNLTPVLVYVPLLVLGLSRSNWHVKLADGSECYVSCLCPRYTQTKCSGTSGDEHIYSITVPNARSISVLPSVLSSAAAVSNCTNV